MAESSSPPPERKPYQAWRSQQSSNWRMKDETPRPEQPARTQQRSFDTRREAPTSSTADTTPGTRLYVGNLLYSAKGEDVQQLFADNGFKVANISMSVDPFSGRNPSYCFVDLETAEEAARAMAELSGMEVLGRPVKINPGMKKSGTGAAPRREWGAREGNGNAYGNENGTPSRTTREYLVLSRSQRSANICPAGEYRPTSDRFPRPDTRTPYSSTSPTDQPNSKRLYVGGLPKYDSQTSIDTEIHSIFDGFSITAISKQISPHPSKIIEGANENCFYLFVDLASADETERAIEGLDGKEMYWGGRLRVNRAKGENKRVVKDRGMLNEFMRLRVGEKENENGSAVEVES
jgi:hypothetical protein